MVKAPVVAHVTKNVPCATKKTVRATNNRTNYLHKKRAEIRSQPFFCDLLSITRSCPNCVKTPVDLVHDLKSLLKFCRAQRCHPCQELFQQMLFQLQD